MTQRRTLTPAQYRVLVRTADTLLNKLGRYADEHMRHVANRDEVSIRRSRYDVLATHRAACSAVAEVSYWSDLDLSEHAEVMANLRKALHADEYALGLGSAAVKEVA